MTPHDPNRVNPDDPAPLVEFLAFAYVRRRGAAAIFVGTVALAFAISAMLPSYYRATAWLAILPSPEFTVRQEAGSRAATSSVLALDQVMKAESEILQSDDLHEQTIRGMAADTGRAAGDAAAALYPELDPQAPPSLADRIGHAVIHYALWPWRDDAKAHPEGSMDAALRRFSDSLVVLPNKDSNVIKATFVNANPSLAARALNALLAQYAQRRRSIYNDPQLAVAQKEAELTQKAVTVADEKLSRFKSAHGFSDLATERGLLLKQTSDATQRLFDAETQDVQSEARLAVLDRQIEKIPSTPMLYQENDTDLRLQALDAALVDLRGRLTTAREHYRDNSQLVSSLRSQIVAREFERKTAQQAHTPSILRSGRSPALDPLLVDRAHSAADRDAARATAVSVSGELAWLRGQLATLNADESQLADLSRRKAAADADFAIAQQVVQEQTLTEAEDARRLANVRILQPARVPVYPTLTKMLIRLAGVVFGFAASFGWLLCRFPFETTVLTEAGLAHVTKLPVLAVFSRGRDIYDEAHS
jgi:uncharacterized protein involved in exopolysaccharide biosynthesis